MKPKDLLVSASLLVAGRRRNRLAPNERERIVPEQPGKPRAEFSAIACFVASAICAAAFIVCYSLDRLPVQTQLMGSSLGLSLLFLAAGLIVTGKSLVRTEELVDDYPEPEHPVEQEALVQTVEESGSGFTRKRLFMLSLGAAGGTIGVSALIPLASMGPLIDMEPNYATPWKRGTRLVDENNRPWRASDIELADFYTAFAEGADKEEMGSSLVVIRLDPKEFDLPKKLRGYPANGIVAYSKICTHAACAISLYRTPLFQPDEPKPALVCPCHYSTFNPADGGSVMFGPAGRNLPMLPLMIDEQGGLRAAGNFDGPVGPSWWGVRMRKPT